MTHKSYLKRGIKAAKSRLMSKETLHFVYSAGCHLYLHITFSSVKQMPNGLCLSSFHPPEQENFLLLKFSLKVYCKHHGKDFGPNS